MKKLEDLNPNSVRRLVNLLSYNINIVSSFDGYQCIKEPAAWLEKRLLEKGTFSALILNDPGAHDEKEILRIFENNTAGRHACFERTNDIGYNYDTFMPENGLFSTVIDLGSDDVVLIESQALPNNRQVISKIEFFCEQDYDEVVKLAAKDSFKNMIEEVLHRKDNYFSLSSEDILDIIDSVIADKPELLSASQARKISNSMGDTGVASPAIKRKVEF